MRLYVSLAPLSFVLLTEKCKVVSSQILAVFHHMSVLCPLYLFHATDKLKDAIIAKIAMQAADLYADAYSNMQVGSVKQMWDKVSIPSHVI